MNNYNFVLIENKICTPFLNLTEQAFYDNLWQWTYIDDLWDYIDENDPSEENLENALYQFIGENMFHKYEHDDIDCFAFVNTNEGIIEYQISDRLIEFVKSKIKQYYD